MVKQISNTLTITLRKQAENYTIEANGPKGIRVDPQPAPQLKALLSDQQITNTLKDLSSQTASATTEAIQKLGEALHDSLFTDRDLLAFGKVQGSAGSDSGARLRLQIEPIELAVLPWETLHDGKDWLSAQSITPLVRKLTLSDDRKPLQKLQVRGALQILFVGASPEGLDDLKIEKTADELERLLADSIKKKKIAFKKLLNATLEDLQKELPKDYHILYFAGHGSPEGIFLDDGQGDDIEKECKVIRGRGDKSLISAERLAEALQGKQTRLVFLAACETSKASEGSRLLRGFAQELAERSNLPAIVAMQYFISDMQANPLTTQFFAAIAAGRPVDVAMAEARSVLMNKGQVNRDVFSPVLYLQADDGALFPKAKNWLAIGLSIVILIASPVLIGSLRNTEIKEIQRMVALSSAKLAENQGREASIESIRAWKRLQESFFLKVIPDPQLRTSVLEQLRNTEQGWNLLGDYQGRTRNVVFSPDGKQLATSRDDGTAHLWDTSSGKQLAVLEGHEGIVWRVVFSPDGRYLATSGNDGTARLWDTSGKQVATFRGHQGTVYRVIFSSDGRHLATSGEDGTVRLWDTFGKQLAVLEGSNWSVAFSPNGQQLATSAEDGTVRLWDISGKQLDVIKGQEASVQRLMFSPSGKQLASYGEQSTAYLWDIASRKQLILRGHRADIWAVAFSPDGKQLATTGDDTVRLWDTTSGRQLAAVKSPSHPTTLTSVAFSPDGNQLVAGDQGGRIFLWDIPGKQLVSLNRGNLGDSIQSVVFSSDGEQLAASGMRGSRIWHLEGIDELLSSNCNWMRDYLKNNPQVMEGDRHLCNGIGNQK